MTTPICLRTVASMSNGFGEAKFKTAHRTWRLSRGSRLTATRFKRAPPSTSGRIAVASSSSPASSSTFSWRTSPIGPTRCSSRSWLHFQGPRPRAALGGAMRLRHAHPHRNNRGISTARARLGEWPAIRAAKFPRERWNRAAVVASAHGATGCLDSWRWLQHATRRSFAREFADA
jgi:hypothetical protein